jgi:hypothetical protein
VNIVFGGAEVPSHRILLTEAGVKSVNVNYWRLKKRGLPKTKDYLLSERFPEDVQIYVDGGAGAADEAGMTQRELLEYAADYQDWVILNSERITLATEFDCRSLGLPWIQEQRKTFWEELGEEKFMPVWHGDLAPAALMALAEMYENVAIPGSVVESDFALAGRVQGLVTRFGTKFHGLGVAKPDNLRQVPFTTASTLSWINPMKNGETIVWDGTRLVRYPAKMKDQARPRYKRAAEDAGLDFEKILNDDPNENVRLAIWSYLQLEANLDKKKPDLSIIDGGLLSDNSAHMDDPGSSEKVGALPDNRDVEVRKQSAVDRPELKVRSPQEMTTLPSLGVTTKTVTDYDPEGREFLRDAPLINSNSNSLRQCNTCFVAANCPAFKPDNTCAFSLPVEVKTKDQLVSLLNAIIEMQGARVAFARFAEELNGGYPDPNVGQEVDRLFKLVKNMKELQENREFIKMTVERQGAGGVLSAIFGDKAEKLKQLPSGGLDEGQTTRIIADNLEK